MKKSEIFKKMRASITEIAVSEASQLGWLWQTFIRLHPADIAEFVSDLSEHNAKIVFATLPEQLRFEVFADISDGKKATFLSKMDDEQRVLALNTLPSDQLTDLFDELSDIELKQYLGLLHRTQRQKVLSLMKFPPESAGGIMDIDALTLIADFTVAKSVQLLQRIHPSKEIHRRIFITDLQHHLIGYVLLEDLVLQPPSMRIGEFMHDIEYVAFVADDREKIAKQMVHYGLMIVPVVGKENHFLGVIPSDTLVEVLQEEASEDVQKMAALAPLKGSYSDAPFWRVLYERSYILVLLLLAQSLSARIMQMYDATLQIGYLWYFVTMLISAGGNSSNQTSAVVIQGLASGDIRTANLKQFARRELFMALFLAIVLAIVGFVRAYVTTHSLVQSIAISSSLAAIVFVSVVLGGTMPIVLKRLGLDPAFSAGPFLATIMDILGVFIYCLVSTFILYHLGSVLVPS